MPKFSLYDEVNSAADDDLLLIDQEPITSDSVKTITKENLLSGYYKAGGTDVAVTDGGTGASTAADARTNLGLVIGTDVLSLTGNGSGLTGLTKTQVGLSNVDNTSDANKPVSTAQQTALDLKANLASPTFTGTLGAGTTALTGNLSITADYAGGTFINTATAQYSSAGFSMYNNKASMGNYGGVQMISQLADAGGTVGEFVLNRVSNAGTYQSSLIVMNLNTNHTAFITDVSVPTKTPASAAAAGVAGTVAWDTNYIYVCLASGSWKRAPIAAW